MPAHSEGDPVSGKRHCFATRRAADLPGPGLVRPDVAAATWHAQDAAPGTSIATTGRTEPAARGVADESKRLHTTPGQRRVVETLLSSDQGMTYGGVAARLGVGLGTVHTHLRRLRERSPEVYGAVMALRREQLEARHARAVWRAQMHSDQWHRAQSARRHYRLFGCWPHERKFYKQIGRLDFLEALRRSRGYR